MTRQEWRETALEARSARPYTRRANGVPYEKRVLENDVITRRDALVTVALASLAIATPAFAYHDGAPHGDEEMVLGDPNAPVTIIEYSSLTCPHCASFHINTLPQVKERYIDTGEARLFYRDFPFDRASLLAAAIARCAGRERFFVFLDVLFRTQDAWSRDPDPAKALAKVGRLGGLSNEAIDACFADQALLDMGHSSG